MTRHTHAKAITIDPRDVGLLRTFTRGYLHEDVIAEHGSAAGAAMAYRADATPHERARLADALDRMALTAGHVQAAALAHVFTVDLGCAWTPASATDIRRLAEIVRSGTPGATT